MLGVALVSWGTVTHSWDASTKTLTVEYTADGVDLNFDNILNQYGAAGQVQKLVISGDFTNTDWTQRACGFIEQCAGQNTIDLDMTGCTKLVSRFVNVKDTYDAENDWADTFFNQFTQDELTKVTKYYYWGQSEADPDKVYEENGKWYVDMEWGDNNPEVTPTETYLYQFEDGTTGNVQEQNGVYTLVNDFAFGNAKTKIKGVKFPASSNFTYIPDELFGSCSNVESVYLPDNIVAIGNKAFQKTSVSEVNFPNALREIGGDAFEHCNMTSVDLSNTQVTLLRWFAFQDCAQLESFVFPTSLTTIEKNVFQRSGLKSADMSACHSLTIIGHQAFAECTSLKEVKVCSHPKVIKGGEGSGAFNNSTAIRTVEVVGCKNTNLVACRCENNAFSPDITYVQTSIDNIEPNGARLIFPQSIEYDQPMQHSAGNPNTEYLGYASSFDYFVGDYKVGVPFKQNQSVLEAFFKFAPRGQEASAVNYPTSGETTTAYCAPDNKMLTTYGSGNGWHEFMNVSVGIVLQNDQDFLRTYSRTRLSGPVLLTADLGITAYRAVDYISTKKEYVENKRGNFVFVPADKNPAGEDAYLTKEECEEKSIDITGLKTFSYATTAGTLYLRPLRPKYADGSGVNNDLSYVPEETGVVLYSKSTGEDVFLIFPPYTGTEYDLTSEDVQYPHTGTERRESTRLESEPDDINLLEGSFGEPTKVAPVWPWIFAANNGKGSYDPEKMEYREFGYSKSNKRWVRLQPGVLVYNRAFAKIPKDFFNNHNEQLSQMPDFTLDDLPAGVESLSNEVLVLDTSFDNPGEADGIKTIETNTDQTVDANAWYTLQGVKVEKPAKGVYIHNNQKVVIK